MTLLNDIMTVCRYFIIFYLLTKKPMYTARMPTKTLVLT